MPYEEFKAKVKGALKTAGRPMTWTEVRTVSSLPQRFPNNRWVRRLEKDIGLNRHRDKGGIIHWELNRQK